MTVKECVKTLENHGVIRIYDTRTKLFVTNQNVSDREVKKVTYHNGYGFKQVNATIHI